MAKRGEEPDAKARPIAMSSPEQLMNQSSTYPKQPCVARTDPNGTFELLVYLKCMKELKEFEKKVIKHLLGKRFDDKATADILDNYDFVNYDHTGVGYFLSIKHLLIPQKREVFTDKTIGTFSGVEVGFVIFLENGELTLECHTWSGDKLDGSFRDCDVEIRF